MNRNMWILLALVVALSLAAYGVNSRDFRAKLDELQNHYSHRYSLAIARNV